MRYYLTAFVTLAAATTGCMGGTSLDTRTFELQHLDEDRAARIIAPYVYEDRPEGAGMIAYADGKLSVRETPDNLDKIARVLEEYDREPPSVRLTFQVIEANGNSESDPAIADIERELRQLFRFEGYTLLAQALLGGTESSSLHQQFGPPGRSFEVFVTIVNVRGSPDSGSVRLHISFEAFRGGGMETTVNARVGQTVVLGNVQAEEGQGTLIIAVKPELVGM